MLEIRNISKVYETGNFVQKALDDVSIQFRESEFVSILGPSGSGKTTLLNIIGGLDNYTSGDLIINGVSTKKYKDNDWDRYRNHSIGFVFQSYNLIPHQSCLANVELSLTLSGISKEERRKRAKEVLKKVGLEDHIHKKPNQMSGGQMQRIAIARALINNPDILLADEPTGALDSETSVQIMDILKEIAKEKLVIMVTHNSDIANLYSTRIVKLLDGKVLDDSNPFTQTEKKEAIKNKKRKKSMSFKTALSLSLNNLLTKKTRTILTAFAGSIGIIGIALILSLSNGVQNYINKIEQDTLSSYPITIEETTMDATTMLSTLSEFGKKKETHKEGKIYSNDIMGDMINMMTTKLEHNNLREFKTFLESGKSDIKEYSTTIQYSYDLNLQIYKANTTSGIVQVNPNQVFDILGFGSNPMMQSGSMGFSMGANDVWRELLDNEELLKTQYDVIAGSWPTNYNEVIIIVNDNNEITDYALYALGLKDQEELKNVMRDIMNGKEFAVEGTSYSYEELLQLTFKLILNTNIYENKNSMWIDKSEDLDYMKNIVNNGIDIKVVGIVKPNEEAMINSNNTGIGYTSDLTKHIINEINNSEIAKEQVNNKEINVFTKQPFSTANKTFDISSLSKEEQESISKLSQTELATLIANYTENATATYDDNLKKLGIVDLDAPSIINIYPNDFEGKESITSIIKDYNNEQQNNNKDENVITYTDLVGLMMKSVTNVINIISYVLVAFVAISLIVSSIMIGIITYISVLERTKEIGILRAIGASKKDISRVFNAETMIVGFSAGIMGIFVTILLNIPINIIIKNMVDISNITSLPILGATVLIIISVILTVVAGLIPAKIASKKDPVESLRTE